VLYEWLRGPRTRAELAVQEELSPRERAVPFGAAQAAIAARAAASSIWRFPRARCTTPRRLWTLNRADFRDVPDLSLI
jgi:hypothetical protein